MDMGIMDLFDFGGLQSGFSFFTTPIMIIELILFAVLYFVVSYTIMAIGRKAGEQEDWMAFVPIASDIYRLRFVDAPRWHVFFFGFTGVLCIGVAEWLFYLGFKNTFNFMFMVMGIIVLIAFAIVSVYVTFQYLYRYYKGFNFNPMLAVAFFAPFLSLALPVLDLYIAYSNTVSFNKSNAAINYKNPFLAVAPHTSEGSKAGRITALTGMYKDAVFHLADMEEIAFGRENSDCQIVFDQFNTDVSRKHCTVRFNAKDGKYVVVDYSKNGTFTSDDHRLQPGVPALLPAGTIIYLGSKKNVFRLG